MPDNREKDKSNKNSDEKEFKFLWVLFNFGLNIVDPFKIIRNYFLKPTVALGIYSVERFKAKTEEQWTNTQNMLIRIFGIVMIGLLIVCGAILMYTIFYFSYMPAVTYIRPLHMQYKRICEDELIDREFCQKKNEDDKVSPYHSYPSAHLQLSKKHMLTVGQPYIISISLLLPDSQKNHDVGMFMVCAELKAQQVNMRKTNSLKASSCRSTMLQYYSPLMHKLKSLIFFPLIVTGFYEQKQHLTIEMFPNYVDDATNPVTDIHVEIQSKVVEFYSTTIEITAHFSGLRYIMFNYPILSATIGICGNLLSILLMVVLCWYHWDNDMEWMDEARKIYKHSRKDSDEIYVSEKRMDANEILKNMDLKDPKNMLNDPGDSSSITTEKSNLDDENLSILDVNESDSSSIEDAEFCLEKEDLEKDVEDDLTMARKDEKKSVEE